ncbi:ABC transporter permease [Paenibacillus cisolokensis]
MGLALLTMIFRKMLKNRWLQLNLWLGLTVCVALFASMPMYTGAILQRTLIKELQQHQSDTGQFPGWLRVTSSLSPEVPVNERPTRIRAADERFRSGIGQFGPSVIDWAIRRSTQSYETIPQNATEAELKSKKPANVVAYSNLEDQAKLLDGRMPSAEPVDGVIEAVVTQKFLMEYKRDLDAVFQVNNSATGETLLIKLVGVIEQKPIEEAYLRSRVEGGGRSFIVAFDLFEKEITDKGRLQIIGLEWQGAFDYNELKVAGIGRLVSEAGRLDRYFLNRLGMHTMDFPALATVGEYLKTEERLNQLLWALYAPVIIMLAFYLLLVSNKIVEGQKTEIAVLRSRGASRLQIVLAYAAEIVILGLLAFAAGPFVGYGFTIMLGASDGFLEFVNRAALQVEFNSKALASSALAVLGAIVLTLLPVVRAARVSIVDRKRTVSRTEGWTFWHKSGIDLILIGISVYLLYGFRRRMDDLQNLGLDAGMMSMDPLLFLTPALFALGGGLLLLRIYPLFIRLVYALGRRRWPPALYSVLIQISRSSRQYLTIQMFLILTVATGLFSAHAARTINDYEENKIRYANGADITLSTLWENDAPPPQMMGGPQPPAAEAAEPAPAPKRVQYTEPPFLPFTELEGVRSAARVFRKPDANYASDGKNGGTATLLGIRTDEFGATAWMRDGLLDRHINHYLNLIATDPKAVLISRSVAEESGLKPGDPIRIGWNGLDSALFTVYGIVDYWPSWNPNPPPTEAGSGNALASRPQLIVAQLATIQNRLALEPYEVWLKLEPGASSSDVYEDIKNKGLRITSLKDTSQLLIRSKNDPFRMAINGVMTLGFVISIVISFCGFLLFWVLTLSGRTLQYGVLRAMGIPYGQLVGMLVSEQILTSGAAVLIGWLCGRLTGEWFVPLFRMSFHPSEQVPPFRVVHELGDYAQLFGAVAFMLAAGLAILGYRMFRIRVHQALKLGEE